MKSNNDDVSRRTWDLEVFEKRAKDRLRREKEEQNEKNRSRKASQHAEHVDGDPFAPTRPWLQKRDRIIDLDSKVGSTEIVSSDRAAGFPCKICNVMLKDSNRYLSHINSKAHQNALGMSMRVRRSTVEEVKEAFAEEVRKRQKRINKKKEEDR